jgi:hypothetical protein
MLTRDNPLTNGPGQQKGSEYRRQKAGEKENGGEGRSRAIQLPPARIELYGR